MINVHATERSSAKGPSSTSLIICVVYLYLKKKIKQKKKNRIRILGVESFERPFAVLRSLLLKLTERYHFEYEKFYDIVHEVTLVI